MNYVRHYKVWENPKYGISLEEEQKINKKLFACDEYLFVTINRRKKNSPILIFGEILFLIIVITTKNFHYVLKCTCIKNPHQKSKTRKNQ